VIGRLIRKRERVDVVKRTCRVIESGEKTKKTRCDRKKSIPCYISDVINVYPIKHMVPGFMKTKRLLVLPNNLYTTNRSTGDDLKLMETIVNAVKLRRSCVVNRGEQAGKLTTSCSKIFSSRDGVKQLLSVLISDADHLLFFDLIRSIGGGDTTCNLQIDSPRATTGERYVDLELEIGANKSLDIGESIAYVEGVLGLMATKSIGYTIDMERRKMGSLSCRDGERYSRKIQMRRREEGIGYVDVGRQEIDDVDDDGDSQGCVVVRIHYSIPAMMTTEPFVVTFSKYNENLYVM
jgi:hypothetical protein